LRIVSKPELGQKDFMINTKKEQVVEKDKFTVIDKRGLDREPAKIVLEEEVKIPEAPTYSEIDIVILGERILIQDFPAAKKIGSILTPDGFSMDINKGRVCGIGPEVKTIKVGDIISKVSDLGQSLMDSKGN